jgi:methyl-accepting chemotaxis protein
MGKYVAFNNLKVGQRLALGFGVVLAMLAMLAALAYLRVTGLSEDIALTIQNRYPKTVLVHTIKDELNATARNLRNLLLMTDAEALRQEYAKIDQSSKIIGAAIDKLDKSLTTDAGRENLKAMTAARQRFLTARASYLKLTHDNKKDEALALLLAELRPIQNEYFAALDKLIDYQARLMEASANQAADTAQNTRVIVVALALAAGLVGLLVGVLATRSITRPLAEAVAVARRVADGDLGSVIEVHSSDETGQLLQALKDMNDSLRNIVGQVRTGTEAIATASSQIASGNLDLSARTEQQAGALEETASSMEELTSTVRQNGDNARQANQLAQSASGVAVKGGAVMAQVVATMGSINDSSKKIVDIIGVIDGIAFQTNILALNAAVEAARAGEQGRGFAVVASEVRGLAQRSASAAKEIKALIDDSVRKVGAGSELVTEAGSTMDEVVASVQRVTGIIGDISSAGHEQQAGIEQINQAVAEMDTVTQQNAALVEEAAAAASSLQSQASHLAQLVSVFKLGEQAATPARKVAPAKHIGMRANLHAIAN